MPRLEFVNFQPTDESGIFTDAEKAKAGHARPSIWCNLSAC
jgi:hypothetical protein